MDPVGPQTGALLAEGRSWRVSLPPPSSAAGSPATGSCTQTQICGVCVKQEFTKSNTGFLKEISLLFYHY